MKVVPVMSDTPLLDRSHKYVVLGPDELIWTFAYESSTYDGEYGTYYWQAYYLKPGGFVIAQGPRSEIEVFEFLTQHAHRLSSDDRLDLALFLRKGGLEAFLAENHTKKKEEVKDDPW